MRVLLVLFLMMSWGLVPAKSPHHHVVIDSVALLHPTDSGHVYMGPFFKDTLSNDSFFIHHYARYLLPMEQLPADTTDQAAFVRGRVEVRRDWVFYYVIGLMVLLIFIKQNFAKMFRNGIASLYSRAATAEIIHDKYSPRWLFIFFSNLFFVMVTTLWLYRYFYHAGGSNEGERLDVFGLILILLMGVYLVKFLVHLFFGLIFKASDAISNYLLNISMMNVIAGMVMLLTTLFLLYSPHHQQYSLLQVSALVLGFFIVWRYLRGLVQTINYFDYNIFYLILYLCALEIAPWFIIIKYFNSYL